MQALSIPQTRRALISLSSLAVLISFFLPAVYAANIGTVVPVMGIVADLIYDSARNLVYLANSSRSEVDIYSVGERRLVGSVVTGTLPSSLALSPDLSTLYVASAGSNTINTINLNTRQRGNDYNVGSRPDAIAVGNDGKVVILGTGGLQRLDTATGRITPVPISPPPTPPGGLLNIPGAIITNSTFAGLVTTASGNLIIGRSINLTVPGAANRLFVYEVASGVVLRSRNVTGLASILSASTDGSRFMAGPLLFDTQTLTILGRTGNVLNATLGGGSAFSETRFTRRSTTRRRAAPKRRSIHSIQTILRTPQRRASSLPVGAVDSPVADLGAVVFRRHRHKANRQWQSSRFCARPA